MSNVKQTGAPLLKATLFLLLAGGAACAVALFLMPDPYYALMRLWSMGRYERYDAMIVDVATKHGVDPLLIKAVVWRESEFHPGKVGTSGERGLMQVGEGAATDWVRANKVETFVPTDLFSPRMNLEIGTWYLARALRNWKEKDDPVPFALAEYNAGKSRVRRWIARSVEKAPPGAAIGAAEMHASIDFPTTKAYVAAITKRRAFYREGGMKLPPSPGEAAAKGGE